MARGKKTDPEIKKSILEAIAAGEDLTVVAKRFHVEPTTAQAWTRHTKIDVAATSETLNRAPASKRAVTKRNAAPLVKKTAVYERPALRAGHEESWGVIMRDIQSIADKTYPQPNDGFLRRSTITLEPKG